MTRRIFRALLAIILDRKADPAERRLAATMLMPYVRQ